MPKWTDTAITRLLKIDYPILLGPFGRGNSSALLAAAVSNAGGLGSYGVNDLAPDKIGCVAADIRKLTDKPFNLNLWVSTYDAGGNTLSQEDYDRVTQILAPYYKELGIEPPPFPTGVVRHFDEQVAALIEAKPAVFSFVFGIPSEQILETCRRNGIITAGGAATADEAAALEAAGVDLVIASGFEAGGHKNAFLRPVEESSIGTFALVPQVVDRVKIPVIAAGGIADGRGVAAALTLGASAAQIGTAFLGCEESGANPLHRNLLFQTEAAQTTLTRAFTGRFARGMQNRYATEMKAHESTLPRYPAQSWIATTLREAAIKQGRPELIALWTGQAAPLLRHHKAANLFASLVKETNAIFNARG